jgi:hypothetical protein
MEEEITEELKYIKSKIEKIHSQICDSELESLDPNEKALIIIQYTVMDSYAEILEQRISLLKRGRGVHSIGYDNESPKMSA